MREPMASNGPAFPRIEAAGKLSLEPDAEGGALRLRGAVADWLGPLRCLTGGRAARPEQANRVEGRDTLGRFVGFEFELEAPRVRASVRGYSEEPLFVFRLEALEALRGLANGTFDLPTLAWPWFEPTARTVPLFAGSRAFGHLYSEFALPTLSDPSCAGFLLLEEPPRPAVVEPLLFVTPAQGSLLLAPLDAFHEQVIAVPRSGAPGSGVRCGWHGELDQVPAGFASELAVWQGAGPRSLLERWGRHLLERHHTRRLSRYADETLSHLSYWTDNGAAYWYRSAPDLDMEETLETVARELRAARVPVRAFQLDSWFYPHETTREINPSEGELVPPTGMLRWEPREDALPGGIARLRERLGDPPLVLHSRHFSRRSPYFERHAGWLDGDRAHPQGPELLEAMLEQASSWGAIQYEQDWLIEAFLGVRGLREVSGRARAWQRALDRAAHARGLTLQWCMATPADFMQTVELERIASIRTSGDYRYRIGAGALWTWFVHGNALARALGLWPFKDVFLSSRTGTGLDGDPHAEVEALLAALSAGPVGIGDRIGRTDRELVLRTCREDGVLLKPDLPLAALDRCYLANAAFEHAPLLAETYSEHPIGRFVYLVALHASRERAPLEFDVGCSEVGVARGEVVAYDWRSRRAEPLAPGARLRFRLEPRDWALRLLAPLDPSGLAVLGDVSKYASAADRRLRNVRSEAGLAMDVLGAPGEHVEIAGYAEREPRFEVEGSTETRFADGLWRIALELPERGWRALRVRP
jgi:hypothetical protein